MSGDPKARGLLRAAALLLFCAAGVGCTNATKIYVQSTDRTNAGNVLHMMVRSVDAKTAATAEAYQEMALLLFAQSQDESVLSTQPIFPGRLAITTVEDKAAKSVVLYFFFTSPGDHWRVQLTNPLPAEVYVDLGQNQIERLQIKR